ncbi:MAG: mechanosensitive ion channel family protein [Pirellulaceae bacterium]
MRTTFMMRLGNWRVRVGFILLVLGCLLLNPPVIAQDASAPSDSASAADEDASLTTPEKVEVKPTTNDEDISVRLERIFRATGWFADIEVTTDEGVVFLSGVSDSQQHLDWAEDLAQKTSDVVAVVNRMSVRPTSILDVEPAIVQLRELGRGFMQMLPLLVIGVLVVLLAYGIARIAAAITRRLTARRIDSQLLQQVSASVIAVLVMLIGLYIALKVSGLSRLAVTVLGGTGLVGLALGFAFRDIAENYLASVLISLNRPFNVGDLIEMESRKGFVRRVTTRGTLLLTIDGNHIQIPNSTVYKSIITNYSSSPRVRKTFDVGIGYDDSVADAQSIIMRTLLRHESVLHDPIPLVLVDSLGAATVNLKAYFWLDTKRFDAVSVCSALMRLTKLALAEANISMPDEAREVVFPHGVPIAMLDRSPDSATETTPERPEQFPVPDADASKPIDPNAASGSKQKGSSAMEADRVAATNAEGELQNQSRKVQQHAELSESTDEENLIK